jgi:transcriptional regulator with XRE-family HTH domain
MSIGQTLRDARLSQGLTLEEISDKTKIRVTLLSLIESDQFEKVGANTYVRGHISAIARVLKLDSTELLKEFGNLPGDTPLDEVIPQKITQNEFKLDNNFNTEKVRLGNKEIKTSTGFNWSSLMVAALALVMVVGVFSFVTRVNQDVSVPPIAETPEVFEEESVQVSPTRTPSADEDNLIAGVNNDIVLVVLEAVDGASWVRASNLDDETLYEGTIRRGESQSISDLGDIRILVGNAGALNVTLNGQAFGKIGGNGEVKRCEATLTYLECN